MIKNAGLFFTSLGVATYFIDLFTNHTLANAFARMRCGDTYLQVVSMNEGREVINSLPCGLHADSSMFVICIAVVMCGLALLFIPKLHPKH